MLIQPHRLDVGHWSPSVPNPRDVLVVAAPHPDDEVLGVGMALRWWADRGVEVIVVGCTDGEASHARSTNITREELRERRASERADALELLGIDPLVVRLKLRDGGLDAQVAELVEGLSPFCGSHTTLLVPWEHDGHPDHRAVAAAGAEVTGRTNAALWRTPIWGKVRRDQALAGRVSHLHLSDEARRAKADAVAAFATQVRPVGPGAYDGPVLHPHELERMLDGNETVLW